MRRSVVVPPKGYKKPTPKQISDEEVERRRKVAAEKAAKWRANDPERAKASERASRLRSNFGITEEQYGKMLALQKGQCAICSLPPRSRRLAVEHDHKTGRVRGLACHFCNRYRIGNNNLYTARRLVGYLESDFDGRLL